MVVRISPGQPVSDKCLIVTAFITNPTVLHTTLHKVYLVYATKG